MAVKKTTRAIIEVLDSEGKVSGYELENVYVYEAEGRDDPMARIAQPRTVREEATEAEVQALRGVSGEKLTDTVRAYSEQIAALQESVRLATLAKRAALAAKSAAEQKCALLLDRLEAAAAEAKAP